MKSRITIEVDFENSNKSVIIVHPQRSEDVRDNLVLDFIQSFGGGSNWCRVRFEGTEAGNQRLVITPLKPTALEEESKVLVAWVKNLNDYPALEKESAK